MKKTLLTIGVFLVAFCYALVASADVGAPLTVSGSAEVKKVQAVSAQPTVGVSIGTVEAKRYSDSGLSLSNFYDADYVAETGAGIYMGFTTRTIGWVTDTATGNQVYNSGKEAILVNLASTNGTVTIPDSLKIDEDIIPVTIIKGTNDLQFGISDSKVKVMTVPATIKKISETVTARGMGGNLFNPSLDALYMLGDNPEMSMTLSYVKVVYVCDKSFIGSYLGSTNYSSASILAYGWDYDWITVNVAQAGTFASTYLAQNYNNWGAAQYVKITGNLNDTDLGSIKKLTNLMKLDLSETQVTSLPVEFLADHTLIAEVKLPSTLETIETSAFQSCTKLQTVELNGIDTIGKDAFYGCSSLTSINLTGVRILGYSAFGGCAKLTNADLSSAIYIGGSAFSGCSALESVNLESAVAVGYSTVGNYKRVDGNTFYNCVALKEVRFGDNLQVIHEYSFSGCTSLEEVTFPSSLARIGDRAFYDSGIKRIKCYAVTPPVIYYSTFGGTMNVSTASLSVPSISRWEYSGTYWNKFSVGEAIEDPIAHLIVKSPLTTTLDEDEKKVQFESTTLGYRYGATYSNTSYGNPDTNYYVGQLTVLEGDTISLGNMTIFGVLSGRSNNTKQYMPTLVNCVEKMRADNVAHQITFINQYGSGEWHFLSLPYDVKVSDIVPSDNTYWTIRRYDSAARAAGEFSSTWVNLTKNDVLEAGKGYIVSAYAGYNSSGNIINPELTFTSGNTVTKNNIFRPTDVIVPLTEYVAEFAHNRSWNLIGNPYPTYYNIRALKEDFAAPITVWNGKSYVAYSPLDDYVCLSPYEAFFVQCPLNATEMIFREKGRLHSDEGKSLYKAPRQSREVVSASERNVFNFELSKEDYEDRARIVFNSEAETEYEVGRDASKFFSGSEENAEIYVSADLAYSINERPVNDGTATLGLRSSKEEAYTLTLTGKFSNEWRVMLTDNETGATVDLTKSSYDFLSGSTDNSSRFGIRFVLEGSGQSGIEDIVADFGEDSTVTVAGLNGVVVYTGRLSDIRVPEPGLYLISNGIESRKAILK